MSYLTLALNVLKLHRNRFTLKDLKKLVLLFPFLLFIPRTTFAQSLYDDFEGNGNITSWFANQCQIDTSYTNPYPEGIDTSSKVLKYHDVGGQFANVGFDAGTNLDLTSHHVFSFKLYVPSAAITGNQPNQIALKLQNGSLANPGATQCEIIKHFALDQWQTLYFDFKNGNYLNQDTTSLPPDQRTDFNRVILQINGEGNTDFVLAYIDDFSYALGPDPAPVYNLVWSDEFNGTGAIDGSKWFHQTQLPLPGGWYNGEIQHYTNRLANSYVQGGNLHIVAKKETYTDQGVTKQYTSARLNSKFAFQYGRVEMRAKLPSGYGTWPAFWMLGQDVIENGAYWDNLGYGTTGWPACGEIDIMEEWGANPNYVQSATHTPSSFGNTVNLGGQTINDASGTFHTYTLDWTSHSLVFSVDSVVQFVYQPAVKNQDTWPFDAPMYLLLNIAIQPSIDPNFQQSEMVVDYVRVYQESLLGISKPKGESKAVVYPNPVANYLTVKLPYAVHNQSTWSIRDLSGKLVSQHTVEISGDRLQIDNLKTLPSGMYVLYFVLNGNTFYSKFIKE